MTTKDDTREQAGGAREEEGRRGRKEIRQRHTRRERTRRQGGSEDKGTKNKEACRKIWKEGCWKRRMEGKAKK